MRRWPRLLYLYPSAIAYSLSLLLTGIFSKRGRLRLALLGYQAPWFDSPIPLVTASQVIGDAAQLTLYEVAGSPGNTTHLEQIVLARLAERLQPKNIFEMGTFDGRSALNLISHAPDDSHLCTLDLPASQIDETKHSIIEGERAFIDKPESGARFMATSYAARITRLYGDSATFDFSPYFGRMDMVFVDASHAYEYVRSDSRNAVKLLAEKGGVILWHDYSWDWPGVIQALNEFYKEEALFQGLRRIEGTTLVMLQVGRAGPMA